MQCTFSDVCVCVCVSLCVCVCVCATLGVAWFVPRLLIGFQRLDVLQRRTRVHLAQLFQQVLHIVGKMRARGTRWGGCFVRVARVCGNIRRSGSRTRRFGCGVHDIVQYASCVLLSSASRQTGGGRGERCGKVGCPLCQPPDGGVHHDRVAAVLRSCPVGFDNSIDLRLKFVLVQPVIVHKRDVCAMGEQFGDRVWQHRVLCGGGGGSVGRIPVMSFQKEGYEMCLVAHEHFECPVHQIPLVGGVPIH